MAAGIVAVFAVTYLAGQSEGPTPLEAGLVQGIALTVGVLGSVLAGRQQGRRAEDERVRLWARTVFRRILVLADGIARTGLHVDEEMEALPEYEDGNQKISSYRAIASLKVVQASLGQLAPMGGHLLDEFREVIPEDVEEVEKTWQLSR